jgi:hypothetical protein
VSIKVESVTPSKSQPSIDSPTKKKKKKRKAEDMVESDMNHEAGEIPSFVEHTKKKRKLRQLDLDGST